MNRNGILALSILLIAGGRYFSHDGLPVFAASMAGEDSSPMSRLPASIKPTPPTSEALRSGCLGTKTDLCFEAGWRFHDQLEKLPTTATAKRTLLQSQAAFLWRRGCLSSNHSACDSLMFFGNRDDKNFAQTQLKLHCSQGAQGSCTILAHWLINEPASKNDGEAILAHQCKHSDDDACEELGRIEVKSADSIIQGVALLNSSCKKGRITSCGLLVSMYADVHPEFSASLIKKIETACNRTRAISACEYLADLYGGETDMRFQDLDRALAFDKKLCDFGVTRNCATAEALSRTKHPSASL